MSAPDTNPPSPADAVPPLPAPTALPSPTNGGSGPGQVNGVRAATAAMVVGALGVVFGDIGTSPLYTRFSSGPSC